MRLDAATLRAEAEAHRARLESPLWSDDAGGRNADWTAQLNRESQIALDLQDRAATEVSLPSRNLAESSPLPAETEPHRPPVRAAASVAEATAQDLLPRLDELDRVVGKLTAALSRRPVEAGDAPPWLESAAGDPHTYDAPDAARRAFCVRLLPGSYERLQHVQHKLGLRTTAGAWELLLRLGLAAVQRMATP